ncbi:MAG: TetR family transcriptional regulator [Burkholderiaceae bacterium]|nr:TetR family transcriptional regulator [Burkholderiaceae bacterium]
MPTLTRPRTGRVRSVPGERPDRRAAILLAAEKLFAEHGYHAVSIRQIAQEAGVPLALVGYYFGQKHELFHAIFAHWRGTISERLALLAQAEASPRDAHYLGRIVNAFLQPVLQLRASSEGEYYALLVARELLYRTPATEQVLADFFDPMAHAFIAALQAACPGSTRAQTAWAYQFTMGALLHHLIDHRVERLSLGANTPHDAQAAPLLTAFITAGIGALLLPAAALTHPVATA